jgi:hypothetical protein
MHFQNALLTAVLIASISALSWALHSLPSAIDLSSFVILCVVAFGGLATAGFAIDYWQTVRSNSGLEA